MSSATLTRVDRARFREAMSLFASGVAIVTVRDRHSAAHGFTATSFSSVSAEPPLVLVCLAKTASCHRAFAEADGFAVSILRVEQKGMATRFATSGTNKFASGGFVFTSAGLPVVDGALATLDCTVHDRHDAGDHTILIGWVHEAHTGRLDHARPAVYFGRRFGQFHDDRTNVRGPT